MRFYAANNGGLNEALGTDSFTLFHYVKVMGYGMGLFGMPSILHIWSLQIYNFVQINKSAN